jgi:two-component system alkaline phosphatase synthesis response regulator PhoP
MSSRILLLEDEPGLVLTLSDLLAAEGYAVESAMDGRAGLARAASEPFDLIVLDVMLPGIDGFEVCRELRRRGKDMAVLMLTARTQLADRILGLKLGADDYLTKPFEPPELLARIEALLRRVKKEQLAPLVRFHFGGVEVDLEKGDVRKGGVPVCLKGKKLDLLRYLILHCGRIVSREELLEGVWQYQPGVSSRTIDVHVASLRPELVEEPRHPRHIHTVRGMGYRFSP